MRISLLAVAGLVCLSYGIARAEDGDRHLATTLFTSIPGTVSSGEQSTAGKEVAVTLTRRQMAAEPAPLPVLVTTTRTHAPLSWNDVPAQGCTSIEACQNWGKSR